MNQLSSALYEFFLFGSTHGFIQPVDIRPRNGWEKQYKKEHWELNFTNGVSLALPEPLQVTEADSSKWKESYVYGAGGERLSMTYLPAYDDNNGWEPTPGAGGAEPGVQPKTLWYMQDALGSTLGLVEKDGRVSSRYHYDEFGVPQDAKKFDLNWPGPDNLFGYTGLGYDFTSSNTYARARYYEPEIGRFISEDTFRGDAWNPQSQNLYTYVENNPLIYVDPTGFAAALIGYVYIIEGPYDGKIETYVGSTAQDIKKRMGNHKWKEIVRHPDSTVKAIEVTADLDIKGSHKGTYFGARNEALRAAEQEVINKYKSEGIKLKNVDEAATAKNLPIWKSRHSVSFAMNSAKLALKGGNRINSAIGVFDIYKTAMDLRRSQFEYAPYYMQDEGGVFTIGYSKEGWFSKTKYHKTYQTGPSKGNRINIDKEEYKFWKAEGEALWGYLDAWGNFVPGLLNPVLPSSDIVI